MITDLFTMTGPICVPGPRRRTSPEAELSSACRRLSPPAGTSSVAADAPVAMKPAAASSAAASTLRIVPARMAIALDCVRLDDHPPCHLHVERGAEPLAVIPVDPRAIG